MERPKTKTIVNITFLVLLVALIIVFLFFFDASEIVERIGIQNSYLVMFFVSLFGGFSAGGSFSFIATLITFTSGGLNPLYLGIIAGVALAIGDLFMFYAASRGRELFTSRYDKKIKRLSHFVDGKNNLFIEVFIFIYMAIAPLPNDLLLVSLAAIKFPQKRIIIPLILGDFVFPMIVIYSTLHGFSLFV